MVAAVRMQGTRIVRIMRNQVVTDTIGGKTYTFKSKLEHRYARYLQLLKESKYIRDWWYEKKRFEFPERKRGSREYTVDFTTQMPDGSTEYHETKGHFEDKDVAKAHCVQRWYPDARITLVLQSIPGRKSKKDNLKARIERARKYYARIASIDEITKGIV